MIAVPDPSDSWKMLVVKYACCSALTFTLYETLITLDDERRCIWKMPRSSYTRCLYHFSKYYALAVQIVNATVTFVLHRRFPLKSHVCKTWIMYRFSSAKIMLLCIELILITRVHMLYGYNRAVMGFLTLMLVGEVMLVGFAGSTLHRGLEFSPACLITKTPPVVGYFGSAGMAMQVSVLVFTLLPAAMPKRWNGMPLLPVMVRDGIVVFFVMSTLQLIAMLHKTFRNEVASIVFSTFISIVSSAGCRLIINLHDEVASHHSPESDSDFNFQLSTSIFEPRPSNDVKVTA